MKMKFRCYFDKSPIYYLKPHQSGYTPAEYPNVMIIRSTLNRDEKLKTIFHELFHLRFHKFSIILKKIGLIKLLDYLAERYAQNRFKKGKKFNSVFKNKDYLIIEDKTSLLETLRFVF